MMSNIKVLIIFLFLFNNSFAGNYTAKSKEDTQNVFSETLKSSSNGNFITFQADKKLDIHNFQLGKVPGFKQYSAAFRNTSSCWMIPSVGNRIENIPSETQFLLIDRGNSKYLMIIPLVDQKTRCSLGGNSGGLELIAETGDTLTLVDKFLGLYLLSGSNPQAMIKQATAEIQQQLKTFKLRSEKSEPWFADYFGWCTWNALYTKLSSDTLIYAAQKFKENRIPVKYMIIDDGWQSETNGFLDSFAADHKKFPHGLSSLISDLKVNYGIDKVFMWQALWGTFKGLDKNSFGNLAIETNALPAKKMALPNKKTIEEDINKVATVGKVFYPGAKRYMAVPDWIPYYNQYFDYLRKQGADGVKVDAMTWVESVGNNRGGRVSEMKNMMQGLQGAVNTHFSNEMINCSSCSNDYLFNALSATVTRSSGDFFPEKPESHGFHVYTNAHTSFWMGDIVLPDWDMFQSGHKSGAFHAAARAISGGPVYTTEVIGTEDKEVLKKLMTSTGRLPRSKDVGRVCTESLFTDPAKNKKAVKIFNTNLIGGVVGVFNCSFNPEKSVSVTEKIKSTDIENRLGDEFAVYRYSTGELSLKSKSQAIPVELYELGFDLFTYVPVKNGFAPIGIVEKYNPGGMISEFNQLADDLIAIKFLEGGKFVAYSEKKPTKVFVNAQSIPFNFISNKLEVDVPKTENALLTVSFE